MMLKYFFELKNRFILIVYFFSLNFFFFYFYKEFLLFLIIKVTCYNLNNFSLMADCSYYFIFTNVTEIFSAYLNLIIYCNLQFLIYFLFFQFSFFFAPAFSQSEYQKIFFFFKLSTFFFINSLIFSYCYAIPTTWGFFLEFQNALVRNYKKNFYFEVKLAEYLIFCKNIYSYCFLYFQMLAILLFVCYQNLNAIKIKKYRKIFYYVLIIFVMFIGSPDVLLNQLCGYFFFIFFFELMLFITVLKNLNGTTK